MIIYITVRISQYFLRLVYSPFCSTPHSSTQILKWSLVLTDSLTVKLFADGALINVHKMTLAVIVENPGGVSKHVLSLFNKAEILHCAQLMATEK